jgi:hypothetical protein
VRARPAAGRALSWGLLGALATLAGCGSDPAPAREAPTTTPAPAPADARALLAARAAAAKDRHLMALYTLTGPDRPERTVVVTRAVDGGWRVDIPQGALGGTADVSVVRTRTGLFQCALPSADNAVAAECVRVAGPRGRLPASVDPRVQHVFADWLEVLTDPRAAIAVSTARLLPGVRGKCFSVESNSASLAASLDVGIYCYATDGTLTGARLGFGTLVLSGTPAAGPPTVTLPGPTVNEEPLPMTSPPPPPSPSATPTAPPR